MNIIYTINTLFYFYTILIIIRVLLTWIPNLDWYSQPLKTLCLITDWYLNLFRKIIPPISGLDISPMIALIILQIIQRVILNILVNIANIGIL